MKSLILHCSKFNSEFKSLATRPKNIEPETVNQTKWEHNESVVALITVEKEDNIETISSQMAEELKNILKDLGKESLVIVPFAHLSNNIADHRSALSFLDLLEDKLKGFKISRVHFGSHKSLLLDIPGHVGNVRFREF
ncbi:MAG: threonyl-tRNA synthetase editing domain-containing protein [Candidatus Pacebacteria bacterium]|nr:threonyl-tRNA synthetase editing domain-containing protein [Candidatus Paceibacterota bacterium]